MNLTTARTKGSFYFVDGLTQLTDYAAPNKEYLPKTIETKTPGTAAQPSQDAKSTATSGATLSTSRTTKPPTATATAPVAPPIVLSYSPKLSDLYKTLEDLIRNTVLKDGNARTKQLCVILDDLSVLLNCGWPCRDVLALVRYLKLLMAKVRVIDSPPSSTTSPHPFLFLTTAFTRILGERKFDHTGTC